MIDIIKETSSENIEYINKEPIASSNSLLKTENDNSSEGVSSLVLIPFTYLIFIVIIIFSMLSFDQIKQIKQTQNTEYAIKKNASLYNELIEIKFNNERLDNAHILSNSNLKSVWGGKIEPIIDKLGFISISYSKVPVEYCKDFIYKQKNIGWSSISISDKKDKINVVNYKNESELSKECSKYNDNIKRRIMND